MRRRPDSTEESLIAQNRLDVIGDALRDNPDYYAQTNSDDLILDQAELAWLKSTLGTRIAVYDHGGHLGNLGDRQQVSRHARHARPAAGRRARDERAS